MSSHLIVSHLESIEGLSGQSRSRIFFDWLTLVNTVLQEIPPSLKAVLYKGVLLETLPKVKDQQAKTVQNYNGQGKAAEVWQHFAGAFNQVLVAASRDLWQGPLTENSDIVSQVYQLFVLSPDERAGLPGWSQLLESARPQSHEQLYYTVLRQLEQALLHPANRAGHRVLTTNSLFHDMDLCPPERIPAWLIGLIQVAQPYYQPVTINTTGAATWWPPPASCRPGWSCEGWSSSIWTTGRIR